MRGLRMALQSAMHASMDDTARICCSTLDSILSITPHSRFMGLSASMADRSSATFIGRWNRWMRRLYTRLTGSRDEYAPPCDVEPGWAA